MHSYDPLMFDAIVKENIRSSNNLLFEKIPGSAKAYLISKLYNESGKDILIITGEGVEETRLKDDISFFIKKEILELPALETNFQEKIPSSKEIIGARHKTLMALKEPNRAPAIVISSIQATIQRILSSEEIHTPTLSVRVGQEYSFQTFIEKLEELGYEKTAITVARGEYSVRGGIIDVFCVIDELPSRIEFFGNEVDSIRLFDPATQKAVEERPNVEISYAIEPTRGTYESFFNIMKENTLLILDDIEQIEDRYASLSGYSTLIQKEETPQKNQLMTLPEWIQAIHAMPSWCMFSEKYLEELTEEVVCHKEKGVTKAFSDPERISFSLFENKWNAIRIPHPFQTISDFYMTECLYETPLYGESLLDGYAQTALNACHVFVVQSEIEKEWIQSKSGERGVSLDNAKVLHGYLSSGFARQDTKDIFVPMSELIGGVKVRKLSDSERKASVSRTRFVTGFDAYDLEPQDSVVHLHHGVGKFLGIEKKPNAQGVEQEFFLIEYAENSKLYVPLHHAHLITKYIGSGSEIPKLHTLGNSRWKKLREDTEKAIVGYASELLKAQANREISGGIEFPPDGPKMILFEAEFPYQETEDQLKAIQDIKKDMCSKKAMDRLICGDVGYGKTEVAMRAAFKAVVDGKKQVAFLVPTTVLAIQHYESFAERMAPFGIRVGMLSRFQKPKQNKELIEKVSQGQIDILIGTHKLLQKDLVFHDLGLIIVDEEQRFGVKAKEHLKMMKHNVDSLTLSATPIPRTLYMSLVGVRDLSTIATPPYDRLPIQTIVLEYNPEAIQVAILREVNRGGQVFYVHNRVETIFEACEKLQRLVPRARITAVHGQMKSDEIDSVFHAFKGGKIDVLVTTSIIENGIDIPNANTIIIERADRFGIAELYQIRGRVGRSNKRAFAYFLVPSQRTLPEIARKRIQAIAQAGGYGGGMKVAMRDLEIRGAGDILGTDQSGHVASIGFHLYCKLLKKTIDSIQGKKVVSFADTKIEIPNLAKLPEWYVNEISLRIEIYQRLGDAENEAEVELIKNELIDRFGKLPIEAEWLITIAKVRVFAASKGITSIKLEKHTLIVERKRGKEQVVQHILIPKIKTPNEFYDKVVLLLK